MGGPPLEEILLSGGNTAMGNASWEKQRSEGSAMETQRVAKPLGWRSGMARDMDMCKIQNPRQSEGE